MTSINPNIDALHASFCAALGVTLPMTPVRERWWFEADKAGMTPEDVALCIAERLRIKRRGGMAKGVELRHVCGDDVRIDELLVEAAVLRANARIKVLDPAKASVLAATGRPTIPAQSEAVHVGNIELLKQLKAAAK